MLAVADPTDMSSQRAAQIVLGADVAIKVAAFDDIGLVLNQRLEQDNPDAGGGAASQLREDDIESLRDLASGAPVVRAVNDLLEKAVELRASDIHIEPFSTGLVVRLRIDGLLRPVAAPAGVLPQAVISPASRSWQISISRSAACRRTVPHGCGQGAPMSTSVLPSCRRSTANPPLSVSCQRIADCLWPKSWDLVRATMPRCGGC